MIRCLCAALAERCLNVRKMHLDRGIDRHWLKRETKCKNKETYLQLRFSEMLRSVCCA